jgi:hypothetical protein
MCAAQNTINSNIGTTNAGMFLAHQKAGLPPMFCGHGSSYTKLQVHQ